MSRLTDMLLVTVLLTFIILGSNGSRADAALQTQLRPVQSLSWSPDGNLLAIAPGWYIAEEHDYAVRIFDRISGTVTHTLEYHLSRVDSVDWSSDGTKLVTTGSVDNMAVVWDVPSWQIISASRPYSMPPRIADLWKPNSTLIANISQAVKAINIWDGLTGQNVLTISTESVGLPEAIDWSPDGTRIVGSFDSGPIVIWDTNTGAMIRELDGHTSAVTSIVWQPSGDLIVSAGYDRQVRIWNSDTSELVGTLEGHTGTVTDLAWDPSGFIVASASHDGTVRLWDTRTLALLQTYIYDGRIFAVDWNPLIGSISYGGENNIGGDIVSSEMISANLTGTITLPSRTPGTSAYAVSLSVKLADSGGALVSEHSPTTDVNGYFTLQDLPQGTYGVWLKHAQSLAVMPSVTLDAPSVSLDFGTLAMGDADDSNQINIADFSILAAAFGTSSGQPGYDARADFTGDSSVGISDFSLLAANFGLNGAPPPAGESGAPEMRVLETIPPELASARLRFLTNAGGVSTRVGAAFSITLAAGNSTVGQGSVISLLDGAEVHLTFDPTKLQVDEALAGLTPGTTLPTVLKNVYDNSAGTIDFAAGTLNAAAQGQFTLVTIRFRALAATGSGVTLVQASSAPYRENVLTLDGAAIPPTLTPLSVKIR